MKQNTFTRLREAISDYRRELEAQRTINLQTRVQRRDKTKYRRHNKHRNQDY